jgi:hypothetical protein
MQQRDEDEFWIKNRSTMQRIYFNCVLLLFVFLLLPSGSKATTTAGTTTRNVNTADGIVTLGAIPGTNGPDWETDEEFQGFSGAVNWYVTWDDNNLYLGRIGGNNNEGSVIYLHADFPGATFDNRAFDYELLNPDVTPMGGVNFAAYLKNGYDEFRTFNGAWSAAATTLAPSYSTQGNGANMEVTIPWSDMSGGNGRPINVRLVMYQIVPTGIACAQEFVYGESPWGTGAVGDGPSLGVNDGVPISLRQPGGCNTGDSTAWRWWGCYPVIGNISANTWTFSSAHLALDTTVCVGAPALPLVATSTAGPGIWTLLSSLVGAPPTTIQNPSLPSTIVSNLSALGEYMFLFTGNGNVCFATYDTVIFTVNPQPEVVSVVIDSSLCPLISLSAAFAGNPSTVEWSLGNGVQIATPNAVYDYSSWGNGSYPFQLVVQNSCGQDTVNGTVEIHCLVGVGDQTKSNANVFPNPAVGELHVTLEQPQKIISITLVDFLGRRLSHVDLSSSTTSEIVFDLSAIPNGRYLLQVKSEASTHYRLVDVKK